MINTTCNGSANCSAVVLFCSMLAKSIWHCWVDGCVDGLERLHVICSELQTTIHGSLSAPIREIAFVYSSSTDFTGRCDALQSTFTHAATSSVTEAVNVLIHTRVPALLQTHTTCHP